MTHFRISKFSLRALALALVFAGISSAFADGGVPADTGASCLSDLGEHKKLDAATQTLLDEIQAVAHGDLMKKQWSNKSGSQSFLFLKSDNDNHLVASVKHLDNDAMDKMIIAAGFMVQGVYDNLGITKDIVMAPLRSQLQGAFDGDSVEFETSVCLSPAADSIAIDLVGIPKSNTDGFKGTLVATPNADQTLHIEGSLYKGLAPVPGDSSTTTIKDEFSHASQ